MSDQPKLRRLKDDDDNEIHASFRFAPAFSLKIGDSVVLIHYCTNSETQAEANADDVSRLLWRRDHRLRAELAASREREARLEAYVKSMASQQKSDEMSLEEIERGCFVEGFDIAVEEARIALWKR